MKLKYEYNGKFISVVQKITGTVLISLLWLVLCVPVFTIGASSRALYHTSDWVLRHDLGYPAKEFFKEFRKQFKKSVAVWIPFLAAIVLIMVNFYLMNHSLRNKTMAMVVLGLLAVVFLLVLVWCSYIFPYISFFDGDDKRTSFKTSYIMMITHPVRSLAIFGLFIVCGLILYAVPISVVALPVLISFLHSVLLEKVLKEYTDPKDWEKRRERYRDEKEIYDQQLEDRADEILHGSGGDDYIR